jgi:hypothetical protein
MTILLKKLLKFAFLLILCSAILLGLVNYVFINSNLKVDSKINKIAIGDSQMECALNDSNLITLKNYSGSATSFFYSYIKLKTLKTSNNQIDSVYLGLNIRSLEFDKDIKWVNNEDILYSKRLYFPFFTWNEYSYLCFNYSFYKVILTLPKELMKLSSKLIKGLTITNEFGGFLVNERNELETEKKILLKKGKVNLSFDSMANNEKAYLFKIIKYCDDNKIKLFLVITPNYQRCTYFDCNNFENFLNNQLKDVSILNYSDSLNLKSSFADPIHLNLNGSKIFTEKFIKNQNIK